MKLFLGCCIGFAIGAGCRWANLPVPSPPTIAGVLLVVSVTLGYVACDRLLGSAKPRVEQGPQ